MIDSHCHINDSLYIGNPAEYVKEAEKAGVFEFLVVGFDIPSSIDAVNIAKQFTGCFSAVGVHPSDVKKIELKDLKQIEEIAKQDKVIAIGEIGLDYYWDKEEAAKGKQKEFFIKQIEIANKLDLPISIHCREAIDDCLQILKNNPVKRGGIMHCFAGSVESAKEFIKLGFLLGFGGTVTFKNAVRPKEVVASIPSTPDPYRGKENHSKYLYLVRNKIAELRNIAPEQVEKESNENFKRVFKI